MAQFDAIKFMTLTSDGGDLDIFSAKSKNMRFNVPIERSIRLGLGDENNLPGLAFTYLGDASLWWVLLEFNGLDYPLADIKPGTVLNIPSRRDLITYLEISETSSSTVSV